MPNDAEVLQLLAILIENKNKTNPCPDIEKNIRAKVLSLYKPKWKINHGEQLTIGRVETG